MSFYGVISFLVSALGVALVVFAIAPAIEGDTAMTVWMLGVGAMLLFVSSPRGPRG